MKVRRVSNLFCLQKSVLACVVGLLFCCRAASGLTQQEVTAAMVQALKDYAFYSSNDDIITYHVPLIEEGQGNYLAQLLTSSGAPNDFANSVAAVLNDRISVRWWPFIRQIGSSSNVLAHVDSDLHSMISDLEAFRSEFNSYGSSVLNSLSALEQTGQYLLSDSSDLSSSVSSALDVLGGILEGVTNGNQNSDSMVDDLDNVRDSLDSIDNLVSSIESSTTDILVLSEGYEYQLQMIGATLAEIYDILHNGQIQLELADSSITALLQGLPDHYDVSVDNWPETWNVDFGPLLSALSPKLDSMGRTMSGVEKSVANLDTNFTAFSDSFFNDYVPSALDFYTNSVPTQQQVEDVVFYTNSVVTNVVQSDVAYESYVNEATNQLVSTDEVREAFSGRFDENPYDGAESAFSDLDTTLSDFASVDGVADTSEVILLGSNGVGLPRIAFDMAYIPGLGSIRSLCGSLWVFIGVLYKLFALYLFLKWFSEVGK